MFFSFRLAGYNLFQENRSVAPPLRRDSNKDK